MLIAESLTVYQEQCLLAIEETQIIWRAKRSEFSSSWDLVSPLIDFKNMSWTPWNAVKKRISPTPPAHSHHGDKRPEAKTKVNKYPWVWRTKLQWSAWDEPDTRVFSYKKKIHLRILLRSSQLTENADPWRDRDEPLDESSRLDGNPEWTIHLWRQTSVN